MDSYDYLIQQCSTSSYKVARDIKWKVTTDVWYR